MSIAPNTRKAPCSQPCARFRLLHPSIGRVAVLAVLSLFTGCCSSKPGRLNVGPAVVYSPQDPWFDTNISLLNGETYIISTRDLTDNQGRRYADWFVPANPEGSYGLFGGYMNRYSRKGPYGFLNPSRCQGDDHPALRVQKDRNGTKANFMTIMGVVVEKNETREAVERDLENRVFVIGNSASFTADRSGHLVVFANDWPGDKDHDRYGNNRGLILLQASPEPK